MLKVMLENVHEDIKSVHEKIERATQERDECYKNFEDITTKKESLEQQTM
jgi:septal ring factor EnvC (AmiA/AmiB activator)